jgi:branched-chain amino acid transport system ATP-binding protein
MLAIGRALVQEPRLLMVDELSLGLAPVIVDRLLPVLHRVAREHETAVLIVEQQVQAALRHADRAYVLNHGELVASGTAAELVADDRLLASSYLGDLDD